MYIQNIFQLKTIHNNHVGAIINKTTVTKQQIQVKLPMKIAVSEFEK